MSVRFDAHVNGHVECGLDQAALVCEFSDALHLMLASRFGLQIDVELEQAEVVLRVLSQDVAGRVDLDGVERRPLVGGDRNDRPLEARGQRSDQELLRAPDVRNPVLELGGLATLSGGFPGASSARPGEPSDRALTQ